MITDGRIVVTGAAGGIGSALARRLHASGARLALTSLSGDKLAALAAELGEERVFAQAADLSSEEDVARFYEAVSANLGSPTAVVNLAGGSVPGQIAETSVEDYEWMWHANVTSAFLSSKHALTVFEESDDPQVINVSSVAGLRPNAVAPLYCTAKAALEMFTRSFALQVKDKGVRVTALSPGGADTAFWGDRPVDRSTLMSAETVVDAIVYALSVPASVQVTSLVIEPFRR